jgi:hypothetical protein
LLAELGDLLRLGGHFALGVGMGLGVGLAQWRVGRKWFGARISWAWASGAGMGTPFILSDVVGFQTADAYRLILLHAALGGVLVGLWQCRTLREQSARAHWGIAACTGGWTVAVAVVLFLVRPGHPDTALQAWRNILAIAAGGAGLGIATGQAVVSILRPSESAA